ncbi:MAG: putative sugar nucleotidyl transferase, partial [Chitinophagaceae bacterium]
MRIVLFDTQDRHTLFPFTATRPVADLLMGMLTIREKWQHFTSQNCEVLTENYLQEERLTHSDDTLYINAHLYFNKDIASQIISLPIETALWQQSDLLAFRTNNEVAYPVLPEQWKHLKVQNSKISVKLFRYPWELVEWNGEAIASDFEMLTYN